MATTRDDLRECFIPPCFVNGNSTLHARRAPFLASRSVRFAGRQTEDILSSARGKQGAQHLFWVRCFRSSATRSILPPSLTHFLSSIHSNSQGSARRPSTAPLNGPNHERKWSRLVRWSPQKPRKGKRRRLRRFHASGTAKCACGAATARPFIHPLIHDLDSVAVVLGKSATERRGWISLTMNAPVGSGGGTYLSRVAEGEGIVWALNRLSPFPLKPDPTRVISMHQDEIPEMKWPRK